MLCLVMPTWEAVQMKFMVITSVVSLLYNSSMSCTSVLVEYIFLIVCSEDMESLHIAMDLLSRGGILKAWYML